MPRTLLAADLGGTNCRFARFLQTEEGALRLEDVWRFPTAGQRDFASLMRQALACFSSPPDLAVLAVPGAVSNPRHIHCPNIPWEICPDGVPLPACTAFINDFAAQGWSCLLPEAQGLLPLLTPTAPTAPTSADRIKAVIGAGTGLGHCVVVLRKTGPDVLSSEAGHALFPLCPDEAGYATFLARHGIRQDGDHLVTGRGLSSLHQFYTGETLSPPDVAARMQDTPVLAHFARLYGRACQTLALSSLCLDGLYVTGGIAVANPAIVQHPAFAAAFLDCPGCPSLLASIPVYLIRNTDAALWGAARCGLHLISRSKDTL